MFASGRFRRSYATVWTFVKEAIDSSEAGVIVVVGMLLPACVVSMKLQNEAALRRIELALCESRSIATQREACC